MRIGGIRGYGWCWWEVKKRLSRASNVEIHESLASTLFLRATVPASLIWERHVTPHLVTLSSNMPFHIFLLRRVGRDMGKETWQRSANGGSRYMRCLPWLRYFLPRQSWPFEQARNWHVKDARASCGACVLCRHHLRVSDVKVHVCSACSITSLDVGCVDVQNVYENRFVIHPAIRIPPGYHAMRDDRPMDPLPTGRSRQSSHGIPEWQHLGLHLQHVFHCFGHHTRIHNSLVTELVHPCVGHDEVSIYASVSIRTQRLPSGVLTCSCVGRPAVLYPPPYCLPVSIQVNSCQHHSMRHCALSRHQSLSFGHAELHVEA